MDGIILTTPEQLEQVVIEALKKALPVKEKELAAESPDTCSFGQAFRTENHLFPQRTACMDGIPHHAQFEHI
ncbi:hypothetical protein EZS27_009677 [termite gut metagenome]|uniref:Uncharacterized protein n=1 Tax=termite gut metagenome TaxID=433724 RepID=A0A5J4S8U1_9ZZZZ